MINKINFTPSFASTKIKLTPEERDSSLFAIDKKYIAPVRKYFKLADIETQKNLKPQELADRIELDEFIINYNNGEMTFIGKDGGKGGADTFIGKTLTGLFPDKAVFKDDIKPYEPDSNIPFIDLEI